MAEAIKRLAPQADISWRRLATPRETMFGLKTDGTPRTTCSHLEIISSVKIEKEVLEVCAEYFNWDMGCFHEFLMENKESKDIWLVKTERNSYIVQEMKKECAAQAQILNDEVNCRLRAEDSPNWKLYWNYFGCDSTGSEYYEKYPHIYQLIFVFNTGTLDEFSCALICDLFLNILDCALKGIPLYSYSHLNMYDVGSKLESTIARRIHDIQHIERYHKTAVETYREMLNAPCSNFNFIKREFDTKDIRFKTVKCLFSQEDTLSLVKICIKKNLGVYEVFIVIINNALLRYAVTKGFKGIFRTRVLHIINERKLLNTMENGCTNKLGSHSIPYMQHFTMKSTEAEDIFKEAAEIVTQVGRITISDLFCEQEALRDIIVKESGTKYNSGKRNPHYCYSVTNMGNLDFNISSENPNNKFQVVIYERTSPAIEGGHFDVIIHIFKGRLNVHFDFSNEYFSSDEMVKIITTFNQLIESII
ncbi:UNVERIFIED_CONTAM: hypothetical protein RMT77_010447 [Armadillidium vulgare]